MSWILNSLELWKEKGGKSRRDSQVLRAREAVPTPGPAWREKGGKRRHQGPAWGCPQERQSRQGAGKTAPRPTGVLPFAAGTRGSHQRARERRPGKSRDTTWRRTSILGSIPSKV